jgi:hypothetical protein
MRMSERTFRYRSGGGKFEAMLETNESGFVTSYPKFWVAEA